jgi:hypothetical protein
MNEDRHFQFFLLFVGGFLGVTLLLSVLILLSELGHAEQLERLQTTEGTLIASRWHRRGTDIVYDYTVAGTEYRSDRFSGSLIAFQTDERRFAKRTNSGDAVTVYYDPDDPADAEIAGRPMLVAGIAAPAAVVSLLSVLMAGAHLTLAALGPYRGRRSGGLPARPTRDGGLVVRLDRPLRWMNFAVPISVLTIAVATTIAAIAAPLGQRFEATIMVGQGGLVLFGVLSAFFIFWCSRGRLLLEVGPSNRYVSVPELPRFDAPAKRLERDDIAAVRLSLDDQVLIQTNTGMVFKKRAELVTTSGDAVPLRRFPSTTAAERFTRWLAERLDVPHEDTLREDTPTGRGPSEKRTRELVEQHGFRA